MSIDARSEWQAKRDARLEKLHRLAFRHVITEVDSHRISELRDYARHKGYEFKSVKRIIKAFNLRIPVVVVAAWRRE